ncbi:MAG: hypothetical protein LBE35_10195, partial [Clostridiales bacterium]|nr:hypothetical protein [Clostridiales bacterium]
MDRDEKLIKQAFEGMNTPEFKFRIESEPKRPRVLRKSMIIAFAAIFVMMTTVVMGYQIGILDRIREAVGGAAGEILQPAEGIPVPNPAWGVSEIFQHIWGERALDRDGIKFEVVAMAVFDNIVDIYFILQDLRYDRLAEDLMVMDFVSLKTNDGATILPFFEMGGQFLTRLEDGKILMHSRAFFYAPVTEGRIYHEISFIRYNQIDFHTHDFGIDLAAGDSEAMHIILPDIDIASIRMPLDERILANNEVWVDEEQMMLDIIDEFVSEGITILRPHSLDADFVAEGVDAWISAVGIAGGALHVQTYIPGLDFFSGVSNIWLTNPDGE